MGNEESDPSGARPAPSVLPPGWLASRQPWSTTHGHVCGLSIRPADALLGTVSSKSQFAGGQQELLGPKNKPLHQPIWAYLG